MSARTATATDLIAGFFRLAFDYGMISETDLAKVCPPASKTVTMEDIVAARPARVKPKADLKVLSHGEITRLRQQKTAWVSGLTDWQLQGRARPAKAVASGKVVSVAVLASHGYKRPTV